MPLEREKIKKTLISIFVVLNVFTVLFMNRPLVFIDAVNKKIANLNRPTLVAKLAYYSWLVFQYAHIVGLDNRWIMFGRQSRFNWWYLISAKYGDINTIALPVPPQVTRTLFENLFIDFKEMKFYLNLYDNPVGRESYARYLCRKHPKYNGLPIKSVIFDLYFQNIAPLKEAARLRFYMYPGVYSRSLNEFKCPEIKE